MIQRILMFSWLVLVNALMVIGQHNNYFSNCTWDNIKLDNSYQPDITDTCIVFVSTRSCEETQKMFLGYECEKEIQIHYFNIYFSGNNWICVSRKNYYDCLTQFEDNNAVVYVEGFGRTFLTALDRATLFSRTYNQLIIMFDWPTYRPQLKTSKNFKLTLKESEKISKPFALFLDTLNNYQKAKPKTFNSLVLSMHSMGNLLMMHAINKNYIQIKDSLFDAIVMTSSCLPQKAHNKWVEKIQMQKQIYITINNKDRTLRGAKIISGFKNQLGHKPRKPFASNVIYLDFSRVLTNQHNYFLYPTVLSEKPYIKDLFSTIFIGMKPDFSDQNRFIIKPKKNRIEIFDLKEAQKGGISLGIGM